MRKEKRGLGVDRNGVQKMMRKRDYLADMSGQFGMNLVANLIGQLTYFYTDKVGLAVGGIGIVMLIAKIVDAVTDLWFHIPFWQHYCSAYQLRQDRFLH